MKFETLFQEVPYPKDILSFYQHLEKDHSMLLMTGETGGAKSDQSLFFSKMALSLEFYQDGILHLKALSANGEDFINQIFGQFSSEFALQRKSKQHVFLKTDFPSFSDEEDKLQKAPFFKLIKKVLHSISDPFQKKDFLMGGKFNFDFFEAFEDIQPTQDSGLLYYHFFVPELYFLINHNSRNCFAKGLVFAGKNQKASKKELISELKKSCQKISPFLAESPSQTHSVQESCPNSFLEGVDKIKQHIIQGDIYQCVLARKFHVSCPDPLSAFSRLTQNNPGPYMFYFKNKNEILFGSSPESALKVDQNDCSIYPIAGTRGRGLNDQGEIDFDLDSKIELDLKNDEKEKSEHTMLVDLARNDLARVCESRSIKIPRLLEVDRYSKVMHIVSKVQGELRSDLDFFDAYCASMNMGTLTGAPKIMAMNILRSLEKTSRGVYGGAIGLFNAEFDFDSCIVIRSAEVKDGQATVMAGAGVVADSVAELELRETRQKARAVILAIGGKDPL